MQFKFFIFFGVTIATFFASAKLPVLGQCPIIQAILVDACGTEQLNEFVIINSGGGFNTSDLQLSFDINNNILGAENNDININVNNQPGAPCGLQPGNPALIMGCANVIPVGTGTNIPANALVILQTSSGANTAYDFTSVCGSGNCVYVIQSTCTRSAGGFTNSGAGTRETILAINGGPCSNSYIYNLASLVGGNGAYFIPPGTYGNGGCVAPPVSGGMPPPIINPIANVTMCGSYTLPAITGTNLSGGQAYYTGPGGTGTQYSAGQVITSTVTLYAYDGGTGCSDQESFTITITPPPTANPAGPLTACGNGMGQATFNLTTLNNTVSGGVGTVNWWLNSGATNSIGTPATFTSGSTTVYATVTNGGCTSTSVPITLTVTPPPTANPAGPLAACDNGVGQGVFNLTTLNNTISGGVGTVNWWTNNGATNPIATPASFTSGPTTVYATVTSGACSSAVVPITLTITPSPMANTVAPQFACANAMGQATFNLTTLNNSISGGVGTVNWWTNSTATSPIATPAGYTISSSVIVYATVTSGGCTSVSVGVQLNLTPTPTANPAGPLSQCSTSGNQSVFNLTSLNNTINGAPGNTINWFSDAGGLNAIGSPSNYTSGSTTVYAQVTNGFCSSSLVPVQLIVNPTPTPNPAGPLNGCAGPGGQAIFNLTTLNGAISGGAGAVNWYTNAAGTSPINNPGSYQSGSTTVYATVDNDVCESTTVPIQLIVNPTPVATPTHFEICVISLIPLNAQYDLPGTISTINGGTGNTVNWYTDAAATNPIDDITDILSLPGTVYATVTNGQCESATVAIPVDVEFAPTANTASATACAGPGGTATFNLTTLNTTINGNTGNIVMFYTNMAATNLIANPTAFTTGSTTVYATVSTVNGCSSNPVAITLTVTPMPTATPANAQACDNGSGQGTFNLTNLNGIVSGGAGTITWYSNAAATNLIGNPAAYTSGPGTVYATVTVNGCTSAPAAVTLTLISSPQAFSTSLNACDLGGSQAVFNLTSANNAVNGANGLPVQWYLNMNGSSPINTPGSFSTGSTIVYAQVVAGSCQSAIVPVTLTVVASPTAIAPPPLSACASAGNQAVFNLNSQNAVVNGGTALTVNWYLNPGATNPVANPGAFLTGSTTVYATVSNGTCTSAPVPLQLTVNPSPTANSASMNGCSLAGNQAIFNLTTLNATVSGGSGTVGWFLNMSATNPIGNPTAFNSPATTVYATVTSGGCTSAPVPVTLTVSPAPLVSATIAQGLDCNGDTNASLNVEVSAGVMPFNYNWNVDALDGIEDPSGLGAGFYSLTVTDNNGCQSTSTITINQPTALVIACSALSGVSTPGGTDGTAQVTISGATAPYSITWSGPTSGSQNQTNPGTAQLTNLSAGNYSVVITDNNGCTDMCSFTINDANCTLAINLTGTNPTCADLTDGGVDLVATGGMAPFTFDWSDNTLDGTEDPSGLAGGTYLVTVTDVNNCIATGSVTLAAPDTLMLSCGQLQPVSMPGGDDGAATITFSGGVAPYVLLWDGPENGGQNENAADTISINNLMAGLYGLTITDFNGCENTCDFTIQQTGCNLNADIVATDVSCNSLADGTISVSILTGTAPYDFNWDVDALDGQDNPDSLDVGTYQVTITDADNCQISASVTIDQPTVLDLSCSESAPESAVGAGDGMAEIVVGGGVYPYTLIIGGSQPDTIVVDTASTVNIDSLSAGQYPLTLIDANGCTDSCEVMISNAACNFAISLTVTSPTCNTGGSIMVNLINAIGPVIYDWNVDSLDNQGSATDLPAGMYTVTVTDSNGCLAFADTTLSEAAPLEISCAEFMPVSMPNGDDGAAQLVATGGTIPYTFDLFGPTSFTFTFASSDPIILPNLVAGTYEVTLTDNNGCQSFCSFDINGPTCNLDVSLTSTSPSCNNQSNGSINITINSGMDPIMYDWNVDSLDGMQSPSGLPSGFYEVTITDGMGCTAIRNTNLFNPSAVNLNCSPLTPTSTVGGNDGSAQIGVNGGTAPYQLDWGGPVNGSVVLATGGNSTISNLEAGDYSVSVTDALGCTAICNFTIDAPVCNLSLTFLSTDESCANASDGAIDVTVTGGALPLNFNWSDNALDGIEDPTGLAPGMYPLTVTDAIGCIVTGSSDVQPGSPTPTAQVTGDGIVCDDDCHDFSIHLTGQIPLTVDYVINAGTGNMPFSFTTNTTDTILTVCPADFGLSNGLISITLVGITDAGCQGTPNSSAAVAVRANTTGMISPTLCDGDSLVINGVTYNQSNPGGTEVLMGANAAGCDSTLTIALSFYPPAISSIDTLLCNGASIVVGGQVFDQSHPTGQILFPGMAATGCDSIVNVSTLYLPAIATNINSTLCPGESVTINGMIYDQSHPAGQEIFPAANGCDSVVNVNLAFLTTPNTQINQTLCMGDSLIVNGVTYNAANPNGVEVLVGAASNGCDSTVTIALSFVAPVTENIDMTLCPGESITVNGQVYDGSHPNGTETIIGGSINGCDSIIVVNLNFFSPVTTNINNTLCEGESITVGNEVFDQNHPGGTVVLTDANGCDSMVVVNLTFLPNPTTQVSMTLCDGESLTVGGQIFNSANPSGSVILTSASGCDSTITVSLQFLPALTASIEGDAAVCAGAPVRLTFHMSGAAVFNIEYSDGVNPPILLSGISDGYMVNVTPNVTTTYTITSAVVAGQNCPVAISGSATVEISSLQAQAMVTSNYDGFGVSCNGSADGSLAAGATGGIEPYMYHWSTNAITPTVNNLAAGTYDLTVTDAAGCSTEISAVITEPSGITVKGNAIPPACFGDINGSILVDLLEGGSPPYEYSLDGQFFQSVPGVPFTVPNLASGGHTIYIQDASDCQSSLTLVIFPPQELLLELGDDQTIALGDSLLLSPQLNFDAVQWQWLPDTFLLNAENLSTYTSPTLTTTYTLLVSDVNGCQTRDHITIFVDKRRHVFIPNVFTPNDDGINDFLTIFAGSEVTEVRSFRIFDRWGNMLYFNGPFQPNDDTYGWDGSFNGKEMNAGVYVYYASILFSDGEEILFKGDVTLTR